MIRPLPLSATLTDPHTRVVVCCGSGGVGKTTTAAALAVRAAERGRKVVVLTIDPARRLAQSLGVAELGNTPQRIALTPETPGELHAMMLNMRRTFDDMVAEHTTPEKAEQIFGNPFYQAVASSFSGTQEYMAMEKLGQLADRAEWDLIVVDTPPSRNALDFLDAPKRLGAFLSGRMIRLIMAPGRGVGRLVTSAMSLALRGVSTVVGGQMLSDASNFLQSLESLFGGFQERADRTYRMLSAAGTQFLVVATPESDALREAAFFVDRLRADRMPLTGLILNRTHPAHSSLSADHALAAADHLRESNPVAAQVLRIHAGRVRTDQRERRLLQRFTAAHPTVPLISVPALPCEVADLSGLRAIGDHLVGTATQDSPVSDRESSEKQGSQR